jgi:hypothetical protein
MHRLLFVAVVPGVLAGAALAWDVPGRGSSDRIALMDALRPHAEWVLGAPVEFVVDDLRVAGDRAFGAMLAQRPGGGAIDLAATPGARRGDFDVELGDGTVLQVLYQRSGDTWVAVHWAIGATDVWWAWDELCVDYRSVIRDYCGG